MDTCKNKTMAMGWMVRELYMMREGRQNSNRISVFWLGKGFNFIILSTAHELHTSECFTMQQLATFSTTECLPMPLYLQLGN